jgi:putative GTP pyrophosphokinase
MTYSAESEYVSRFATLKILAGKLERHLFSLVSSCSRIDRVSARAKSIDRYAAKAKKLNPDGSPKYDKPKYQIQDQIGARITVFYLSDIELVKNIVLRYFKSIEIQDKFPKSDAEFGYFGLHFVLHMPSDIVEKDEEGDAPQFFELQIKTLFQHAWSEAHHDLGYKSDKKINSEHRRMLAFTAAQAWGADKIFSELLASLDT